MSSFHHSQMKYLQVHWPLWHTQLMHITVHGREGNQDGRGLSLIRILHLVSLGHCAGHPKVMVQNLYYVVYICIYFNLVCAFHFVVGSMLCAV